MILLLAAGSEKLRHIKPNVSLQAYGGSNRKWPITFFTEEHASNPARRRESVGHFNKIGLPIRSSTSKDTGADSGAGFYFETKSRLHMAYGNWGAYVYKNGERQTNREDNTPYSEDELEAGYYQAFGGNNEDGTRVSTGKQFHCCHASLGNGPIRLCGYKSSPEIFWKGECMDIAQYAIGQKTADWYWYESEGIEGEIEGYRFKAWPSDNPEAVNLELIEPDGTIWTGKSGYCMGAGHDD